MNEYCHSCTAPLTNPDFKGISDKYCKYCTDENGKLKPRLDVQKGLADWLKSWQPGINDKIALTRAEHLMRSTPTWAEK